MKQGFNVIKKIALIVLITLISLSIIGNFKIYANDGDVKIKNETKILSNLPGSSIVPTILEKRVIIISGIPATGKTCYGERISKKTRLPFISKDNIKEKILEVKYKEILEKKMFDSINLDEQVHKNTHFYGPASYAVLFHIAECLMKTNISFVLESNFTVSHADVLNSLIEKYGYKALTILFDGDIETLHRRFCERDVSDKRHLGHKLTSKKYYDVEVFKSIFLPIREFSVGDKITVDTSDFSNVDYDDIDASVIKFLRNSDLSWGRNRSPKNSSPSI